MKQKMLLMIVGLFGLLIQGCSKDSSYDDQTLPQVKPYNADEELSEVGHSGEKLGQYYVALKVDKVQYNLGYDDAATSMNYFYGFTQLHSPDGVSTTYYPHLFIATGNDCTEEDPCITSIFYIASNPTSPLTVGEHDMQIALNINGNLHTQDGFTETPKKRIAITVTKYSDDIVEGNFKGTIMRTDYLTGVVSPVKIVCAFRMVWSPVRL